MNLDDELSPRLFCTVELNIPGPNEAVINTWAADALRKWADRIEKGELEDGEHYPVTDGVGKDIGEAYIAYSADL